MSASEGGLEVVDLHVSYGAIAAVHGIDLTVPAGSTVALIGPNGAGKTTTLRAIGGQQRSRGKVKLGGRDISNWRPYKVAAAGLAQVPQGRRLFPDLTVEENLLIGGWDAPAPTVPPGSSTATRRTRGLASAAPSGPARSAAASSRWSRSRGR